MKNRAAFFSAFLTALILFFSGNLQTSYSQDVISRPYELNTGLESRSISFENTTGEKGKGGMASSNLGQGRKGAPQRAIKPGETVTLCDIKGPGTIRHVWITMSKFEHVTRQTVIRAYWDGQPYPSIESPVGDFMGMAHGVPMAYFSAVHSYGINNGMNIWLPMPFLKNARLTFTNESDKDVSLYYQIDYTIGDKHPQDVGRLHVLFRRENPTIMKKDFEILPKRTCKGRYIGAVIGIRNIDKKNWWGEGEIKIYMDGDTEFPTICGTGSEDYVGHSYGVQQNPFLYNGCSLNDEEKGYVSMYRWHLPDPIYWKKDCRITMQQIEWNDGLHETVDDWCAAAFWYEPVPSAKLPEMPDLAARMADLPVK